MVFLIADTVLMEPGAEVADVVAFTWLSASIGFDVLGVVEGDVKLVNSSRRGILK